MTTRNDKRKNRNFNTLEEGLRATWQAIGADVIECDPDFDESNASHVAEIVLDANHLESYGNVSQEELTTFKAMSVADQLEYAALCL